MTVSTETGCTEYGPEISAYLDDGLAAAERARVEAHVGGCAACAGLLRASRELDAALRELPRIQPSTHFEARLRARLAASAPARRPRSATARWTALAAAAAIAALLLSPGSGALSNEDWELLADAESFDLMLSDDHELLYALDVLESWDEKEEI